MKLYTSLLLLGLVSMLSFVASVMIPSGEGESHMAALPELRSSAEFADRIAEAVAERVALRRLRRPPTDAAREQAHGTSAPAPSGDRGSSGDPR